jgi:hypothetical protein
MLLGCRNAARRRRVISRVCAMPAAVTPTRQAAITVAAMPGHGRGKPGKPGVRPAGRKQKQFLVGDLPQDFRAEITEERPQLAAGPAAGCGHGERGQLRDSRRSWQPRAPRSVHDG